MLTREQLDQVLVRRENEVGVRRTNKKDSVLDIFCTDSEFNYDDDPTGVAKECHGCIWDGDDLIFPSPPVTDEFILAYDCEDSIRSRVLSALQNPDIIVKELKEISVIRVFTYKGVRYVATIRQEDAFESRWGSKVSFGDIFKSGVIGVPVREPIPELGKQFGRYPWTPEEDQIFEKFLDSLDPESRYTFIITEIESTRKVCAVSDMLPPSVYLHYQTGTKECSVPSLPPLHFSSVEDIFSYVREETCLPFSRQGLLFWNTKTHESFKLVNSIYDDYFQLRYNLSSVGYAYLHNIGDEEKTKKFLELYPGNKDIKWREDFLRDLVHELKEQYFNYYCKRVQLPVHIYQFFKNFIQPWFEKENPDFENLPDGRKRRIIKKRVSVNIIRYHLYNISPVLINKFITEKKSADAKIKRDARKAAELALQAN